jgi:hypothetical protein
MPVLCPWGSDLSLRDNIYINCCRCGVLGFIPVADDADFSVHTRVGRQIPAEPTNCTLAYEI